MSEVTEQGQPQSARSAGSPVNYTDDRSAADALSDVGASHGSAAASTPSPGEIAPHRPAGA